MELIATALARLEGATGLAEIFSTACDAFELMLPVIEEQQDPAGGAFTSFVIAATYAANGRDALLFAPSLPAGAAHRTPPATQASTIDVAIELTRLCRLVDTRLTHAAALAADQADALACAQARRQASRLVSLLTGLTGP